MTGRGSTLPRPRRRRAPLVFPAMMHLAPGWWSHCRSRMSCGGGWRRSCPCHATTSIGNWPSSVSSPVVGSDRRCSRCEQGLARPRRRTSRVASGRSCGDRRPPGPGVPRAGGRRPRARVPRRVGRDRRTRRAGCRPTGGRGTRVSRRGPIVGRVQRRGSRVGRAGRPATRAVPRRGAAAVGPGGGDDHGRGWGAARRGPTCCERARREAGSRPRPWGPSPTPLLLWTRTADVCWVNDAFTRMSGYTVEDARGVHTTSAQLRCPGRGVLRDLWDTVLAGRRGGVAWSTGMQTVISTM